eukprot:UN14062
MNIRKTFQTCCKIEKCINTDNLYRCKKGCRLATYCSTKCEKLDWKNHKELCKFVCGHKFRKLKTIKNYR